LIWRFDLEKDSLIEEKELSSLPSDERENILRYGYFNAGTRCHVVSFDNSKYINHSFDPNMATAPCAFDHEGVDFALRDIRAGEELTMDYTQFDGLAALKLPRFSCDGPSHLQMDDHLLAPHWAISVRFPHLRGRTQRKRIDR
jgi:hypothetical protein